MLNNIRFLLSVSVVFVSLFSGFPTQANKYSSPEECARSCTVPCIIARCPKGKEKTSSIDKVPRFRHGYEFQDCNECPKMKVVRGDTFTMGTSWREKGREKNELPRHSVRIRKFAVGQYEVTVRQYMTCVDAGKCREPEWREQGNKHNIRTGSNNYYKKLGSSLTGNDYPIVGISWDDAKTYVRWLRRKTGKKYRLLTESEWEYVASAKRPTAFWWGNSISTDQVNYDGRYTYNGPKGVYRKRPVPVGSFDPNPFGLYNVHGNVWEWVEDCWHHNYQNAPKDGSAWLSADGGNCGRRVLRGGSWYVDPQFLRARYRYGSGRGFRSFVTGFRVARTL